MDPEAPHRTATPLRAVALTGKLFPWSPTVQPWSPNAHQPVFISVIGSQDFYLACFTRAPDLRAMMTRLGITGYTIKQIDDGYEFRSSLPSTYAGAALHVILDPYFLDNGRVRYDRVIGRD